MVEYAKKVLDEVEKLKSGMIAYRLNKQQVRLGCCAPAPSWGIEYLLHHQYPDLSVISSIEPQNETLIEGLKNQEYSMIILDYPIYDKNYISVKLFSETLYVAVKPDDPLALKESVTFEELDGTNFL